MSRTKNMQGKKYLYSFIYDNTERELCQLESRCIFDEEEENKILFSDVKVEPSRSAFIKNRLDVISLSENYASLIEEIKKEKICVEGFKVEYLVFDGDETEYKERLGKLKDIGYSIEGNPDYYNPTITYAICYCNGIWYFGGLIKNKYAWHKHKKKPHSYSNSISINIAKALVNIASKANKEKKLLDACCGAGTIMLEACFSGNDIEGCDINWKLCRDARANISHFNYTAKIYRCDIKSIIKWYDAAIIDLPYNLLSSATNNDILHIISSAAAITDRIIIVSTSDIADIIKKASLELAECCDVSKRGKTNFVRKIWICEKSK